MQKLNQQHIEKYQRQQQDFQDQIRRLQGELERSTKNSLELS